MEVGVTHAHARRHTVIRKQDKFQQEPAEESVEQYLPES